MIRLSTPPLRRAAAGLILAALAACTPAAPPPEVAALAPAPAPAIAPAPAPAVLPPPPPVGFSIVDPPVEPGSPVLARRGPPPPVVLVQQPARLSPPGEPAVLPPPILRGERQTTLVEAVPQSLVVTGGAADARRLLAFLNEAGRGRLDALHLEVRGASRGAVRAVVRAARRAGVDPLKIAVVPGAGHRSGVEVVATRYAAIPPVCPSQAIVGPSVNDNDVEPTLGCSTRGNLAAMVNDPADLLGNTAVVPADGARATLGIERYRGTGAAGAPGRQDGSGRENPGEVPLAAGFGPAGGVVLGPGGPVSR